MKGIIGGKKSEFNKVKQKLSTNTIFVKQQNIVLQTNNKDNTISKQSKQEKNKQSVTMEIQKQPPRGVLNKRCSENVQQIYRRAPMSKCDFNKVASNFIEIALRHGCSPVNLLHIFRTPFPRNTSGWLLLKIARMDNSLTS